MSDYTDILIEASELMHEFRMSATEAIDRALADHPALGSDDAATIRAAAISELADPNYPCPVDFGPTTACSLLANHTGPHRPVPVRRDRALREALIIAQLEAHELIDEPRLAGLTDGEIARTSQMAAAELDVATAVRVEEHVDRLCEEVHDVGVEAVLLEWAHRLDPTWSPRNQAAHRLVTTELQGSETQPGAYIQEDRRLVVWKLPAGAEGSPRTSAEGLVAERDL
jgi:hypothetical protein